MTRHQYVISALVSQTLFGGETSGSVAKCQLFSQVNFSLVKCFKKSRLFNCQVLKVIQSMGLRLWVAPQDYYSERNFHERAWKVATREGGDTQRKRGNRLTTSSAFEPGLTFLNLGGLSSDYQKGSPWVSLHQSLSYRNVPDEFRGGEHLLSAFWPSELWALPTKPWKLRHEKMLASAFSTSHSFAEIPI